MTKGLKRFLITTYVALSIGAFISLYYNAWVFPPCEAAAMKGEVDTPLIVSIERKLQKLPLSPKTTNVFFTSYNPEAGQTDSSPCIGASGQNQCELAQNGARIIALSQDLTGRLGNKKFTYGNKVVLKQINGDDPRCNGIFIVLDTMNKRFAHRGDLFQMNRANNTSCHADVYKLYGTNT